MNDSILNDENILFHGIGYNLFNMIGVLKYGISSYNISKLLKNPYFCVNTVGSNGYNYICATISPSINGLSSSMTYNNYIRNGISFVINKTDDVIIDDYNKKYSSYNDICYIKDKVPLDNMIGIMINEDILNMNISKLPLFLNKPNLTYSTVVPKKCAHMVKCMEYECDYMIDTTLLDSYIKNQSFDEVEKLMKKYIGEAFCNKFSKSGVRLVDVINYYNDNLTLYNQYGYKIKLQNVTKK